MNSNYMRPGHRVGLYDNLTFYYSSETGYKVVVNHIPSNEEIRKEALKNQLDSVRSQLKNKKLQFEQDGVSMTQQYFEAECTRLRTFKNKIKQLLNQINEDNLPKQVEKVEFPPIQAGDNSEKGFFKFIDLASLDELLQAWYSLEKTDNEDFFIRELKPLISDFFASLRTFEDNGKQIIGFNLADFKRIKEYLKDPITLLLLNNAYKLNCKHRISYETLQRYGVECPFRCETIPSAQIDKMLSNLVESLKKLKST